MKENTKYTVGREGEAPGLCNKLITEAMEFYKIGDLDKAISNIQKALQLAQKDGDTKCQIIIYQVLGTCQRLTGADIFAWDSFSSGWKLVETLSPEIIKNDTAFMFYAFEMLKIQVSSTRKRLFYNRFNELWGDHWEMSIYKNSESRYF